MKLTITYVVLEPGVGLPPERKQDALLAPLRDRLAAIDCPGIDRLRLRLIIGSYVAESRLVKANAECLAEYFVAADEFRSLRLGDRAAMLRDVASKAVNDVINNYCRPQRGPAT